MRSRAFWLVVSLGIISSIAGAAQPGNKRTILTSGEKVFPIRYQLGSSTVLYFGAKPETVICGNRNYFNIEKIKDAITIQPLSNFSTNLMVISGNRRYLFYLIPASGSIPDGFVEVKWIPEGLGRPIRLATKEGDSIKELGQKMNLAEQVELVILQERTSSSLKKKIIEVELRNKSGRSISTNALEIIASRAGKPLERQLTVWEKEDAAPRKAVPGRIILPVESGAALRLSVGFRGRTVNLILKGDKR